LAQASFLIVGMFYVASFVFGASNDADDAPRSVVVDRCLLVDAPDCDRDRAPIVRRYKERIHCTLFMTGHAMPFFWLEAIAKQLRDPRSDIRHGRWFIPTSKGEMVQIAEPSVER
jgi:hypothetical protein